jgi:hypothetical protein
VSWKQHEFVPPSTGRVNNLTPPADLNFPTWAERQRAGRQGDGNPDFYVQQLRRESGYLTGQSKPLYLGDTK